MQRIFLMFCFCASLFSKELEVSVKAKRAILFNPENGVVLFDKNCREKAAPASMTKLAMFLYALERYQIDYSENVVCSPKCLVMMPKPVKQSREYSDPPYYLEPDGTSYDIVKGEIMPLGSLFYGMMLVSGNDASNVVANHLAGSIDTFVQGANEYVQELGCYDTHFANPHGLHFPTHFTTAYDMALITKEALKNEQLLEIVGTLSYMRPQTNKKKAYEVKHNNRMIKKGPYFYPKAIGMKTGNIEDAGYCLATVAEHEGRKLIAILMGGVRPTHRYQDAITLFDAAFVEKQVSRTLFTQEEAQFIREVPGAKQAIEAKLHSDCVISYFPAEEPEVLAEIVWNECMLPIKKGSTVGTLVMKDQNGFVLQKANLFSAERVTKAFTYREGLLLGMGALFTFFVFVLLVRIKSKSHSRRASRGAR